MKNNYNFNYNYRLISNENIFSTICSNLWKENVRIDDLLNLGRRSTTYGGR